jgi:hypothetical protein
MLSSIGRKPRVFLSPVCCMSGCFQKGKGWKTKEKAETDFSQNEKSDSHFETTLSTPRLQHSIAPVGPKFEHEDDGPAMACNVLCILVYRY